MFEALVLGPLETALRSGVLLLPLKPRGDELNEMVVGGMLR